ncbi:HlyD family secretion protein [Sediminitomix flava]|uniref:HlyD family secretion protein n=1 Tax=Sediminitomix flava TaxID=379075 RepID=A0A315ZD89_SEDFL|nr:biotin/lipoyl-binding protein [Sediminitomix flava]PWJ43089.1 HlyD family secretion protein [Sediminitomix flava]
MKKIYTILFAIAALTACQNTENETFFKGKLKREVYSVASKVPGRITELRVSEGQTVHKGDTLAMVDVPEAEAKLQQAEGAVAAAKAQYEMAFKGATKEQIEQVNAAYNAAKEQFGFAEKSLNRVKQMYDEKLITEQKYDEVHTKYLMAKAKLEGTEAKKEEVESGVRSEKQRMALGTLRRAEGALQEVNVALGERYLIAPADMTLETVALKVGELALPGYNIFVGYAKNETYFRFAMAEQDVANYKIGTKITVTPAFGEQKPIQGKLVSIKELSSYAARKSMNPNYEVDQSLYELKIVPTNFKETEGLLTNTTLILK